MSNTDGLITMNCDYCEKVQLGYIDYKPAKDCLDLVGAQFCCNDCYQKRLVQELSEPAKFEAKV